MQTKPTEINHITLSTGHNHSIPRREVSDDTIKLLAPWVKTAIAQGVPAPLPVPDLCHYSAKIIAANGALIATVYAPAGPHSTGRPHTGAQMPLVTLGVAQNPQQAIEIWANLAIVAPTNLARPPAPWCAVAIHAPLQKYIAAAQWLGDFERCIAWTWIERG